MFNKKQNHNWFIDVVLLVGFLFSFYLDLTGVIAHQWLGLAVTLLAVIHLVTHWNWVKAVTSRLFSRTSLQNRGYYLFDLLLMLGFLLIALSGFLISTWLELPLQNYPLWSDVHTFASVITLGLTVVKLGMHGRWIVRTTRRIFAPAAQPSDGKNPIPGLVPALATNLNNERRQFLVTMGVIGLGSALAASNLLSRSVGEASESLAALAELDETELESLWNGQRPVTVPQKPGSPQAASITTGYGSDVLTSSENAEQILNTTCSVRCDRRCSYPGDCRRYVDQNSNRLCDLGECM